MILLVLSTSRYFLAGNIGAHLVTLARLLPHIAGRVFFCGKEEKNESIN